MSNNIYDVTGKHGENKAPKSAKLREDLGLFVSVIYVFVIMEDSVNDPNSLVDEIFGESLRLMVFIDKNLVDFPM